MKDNNIKVNVNLDQLFNIRKEYKKIKKYMRSSIYEVKKLDGTESIVSNLLNEDE